MAQILLRTNRPQEASKVLREAIELETLRVQHSLDIALRRLKKFEQKYNISSKRFIKEWTAEDLEDKDMEYVEWAGEYHLFSKLNERLTTLKSIQHVSS
jgi:hypothetical protein